MLKPPSSAPLRATGIISPAHSIPTLSYGTSSSSTSSPFTTQERRFANSFKHVFKSSTPRWEKRLLLLNERHHQPPRPKIEEFQEFSKEEILDWTNSKNAGKSTVGSSGGVIKPISPVLGSVRTGLPLYKIGMLSLYDEWGKRWPVTVLHLDRARVVHRRTLQTHGYSAVCIGMGYKPVERQRKAELGLFMKAGVGPKDRLEEFRVSPDCVLPQGTKLSVRHFVPGQQVFISGISRARGWQGPMKRHNFSGLPQDGGVGGAHRCHGSVGQESVQRVDKGKKMAGHKGPEPVVQNSRIFRIDAQRNYIFLHGSVPGRKGSILKVHDARGRTSLKNAHIKLPYPTFVPQEGIKYPVTVQMPPAPNDPFLMPDRPLYQRND